MNAPTAPPSTFDYVIVGGGSAGCVLAGRLSEDPGVSVALLEAGPPDHSSLVHCPAGIAVLAQTGWLNWGFETVPQAGLLGRRGYQPRGKVLGGSSSVNAMVYIRGQREDYDHWAAQGNPGWAFDDVLPYFRKAEHNERGADEFHGSGGPLNVKDLAQPHRISRAFVQAAQQAGHPLNPDFNGPSQEGVGLYQVTHRQGERFSAAKAYLANTTLGQAAPALSRPNLRVITGAHATRIVMQGRRAVGVAYWQAGEVRQVAAKREVLLSAGALQSPQLLMLSGIGPGSLLQRHGIATAHHLPGVGQNLHDHLDVVQVVHAPRLTDLFGISPAGLGRTLAGLWDWHRRRQGMLTTNFAEAGGFIKSRPTSPLPDLQLHFVIGKLVDHGRKAVWGHGYSCHVCLLQPRSRGSVALTDADPRSPPRIDPNFLGDAEDLETLVRGFKLMRGILGQPALAGHGGHELPASRGAETDDQIAQFIRERADTVYHPVGSCRMGPGEGDVVDARLRVHGVQGLRVVDASIMPRIVSGNTNAPTIMVAEKAAAMIKDDAR
jgi:choline dehydrogenase-like flavoprotein